MRARVGFVSLGCPKNLVDTENMIQLLSNAGATITGNQNDADIVVINTCGFLEAAKQESLSTIGEFVELKKKKKLNGVVVTGCMTERYLVSMHEKYPEVDAFLQTKEFSKITEVVDAIQSGDRQLLTSRMHLIGDLEQLSGHSEIEDYVERSPSKRSYAYVKIAEGCNRVCTFCIIPKLRGKLHSRSIDGVLDEVKQLVAAGTSEIIFIAQDLTSYGRDRSDGAGLLELLKAVENIPGLHWFRLMYNYPRFFTDELIEFLAESKKFARYLDIPFQHASDRMLKAMKRPETAADIRKLIAAIRKRIPDIAIRTTLMVGFPGESEADFEELLDFVSFAEFSQMGAFTFFQEKGTPSFEMENQIPEKVKQERYQRLMQHQKLLQKKKLKRSVGDQMEVIIDGFAEKTKQGLVFRGRHAGQAPDIDGVTYVLSSEPLSIGQLVPVEIAKVVGDYDLLGAEVAQLVEQRIRNA